MCLRTPLAVRTVTLQETEWFFFRQISFEESRALWRKCRQRKNQGTRPGCRSILPSVLQKTLKRQAIPWRFVTDYLLHTCPNPEPYGNYFWAEEWLSEATKIAFVWDVCHCHASPFLSLYIRFANHLGNDCTIDSASSCDPEDWLLRRCEEHKGFSTSLSYRDEVGQVLACCRWFLNFARPMALSLLEQLASGKLLDQ